MKNRIQRVNHLIKEEISKVIIKEVEFPPDFLVTVSRVDISPNLNEGKVFISVLPEKGGPKIINILNQNIYNLQQKINQRLNMRPIPRLIFVEEKETAKAAKIEKILEQLKGEEK